MTTNYKIGAAGLMLVAGLCIAEQNIPETETRGAMPEDAAMTRMETRVASEIWQAWCAAHPAPFRLFGEERRLAVRNDILPAHWFETNSMAATCFCGTAQPGEFYPFQICVASETARELVWNAETDLPVTCVTPSTCRVRPHGVKPIWVMLDIPSDAANKTFRGKVRVTDRSTGESQALPFSIDVRGAVLTDGGIADSWRLARLKWLASDVGREETVTKPYVPITVEVAQRTVKILGRELVLGTDGLPAQIKSFFNGSNTRVTADGFDLLAKPITFTSSGLEPADASKAAFAFTELSPVCVRWRSATPCGAASRLVEGSLDYTGKTTFRIRFDGSTPSRTDFELRMPADVARFFEGLGKNGGAFPTQTVTHVWSDAFRRDAVWLGRVNGGIAIRFYDETYRSPFVNVYYPWRKLAMPRSWAADAGSISVTCEDGCGVLRASNGRAPKGATWIFDLFLTPFHTVDMPAHLTDRYNHLGQGRHAEVMADVRKTGASIVNIHHNTLWNPYINYPYNDDGGPLLKKVVREAHAAELMLKIYYTTREITQNMPEFFALKSLDGEVIAPRDTSVSGWPVTNIRGPHPWLTQHVGDDVVPAWRETVNFPAFYPPRPDLSVLTTPDTRWDNFYLAGLDHLVRTYGIDGIYVDDSALSGASMQRARRILDRDGRRRTVDNHSYNHHCPSAGGGSSNLDFIDLYPYFDLLWRGEGFEDNTPSDFWLIERSGLAFGLPGEMLGCCDKVRGMLFGMTDRLNWGGHPQGLWKFFDETDLPHAELLGWWDDANPVKVSGSDEVKASVWRAKDHVVLIVANFASAPRTVTLTGDAAALGCDLRTTAWELSTIDGVQKAGAAPDFTKPVTIKAAGGWILRARTGK